METCFIVNPNSRGGRGLKTWNRVRTYLARHGIGYELFFTSDTGNASYIARKLSEGLKENETLSVFVIGDDMTLNGVLNGLDHLTRVNLGFISAAPEEGCARSLRLSRNPKQIFRNEGGARTGRIDAMDYGVLTCDSGETIRRFACSSGIGFDAALFQRAYLSGSFRGGITAIKAGRPYGYRNYLAELLRSKPCKGYIILDDSRRVEFNNLMFVSAHIHPYEGASKLAKYADPKDGMLEICAVSCRKKLKLLPMFIKSRFIGLNSSGTVRLYQCREARIHFDRPCYVHTDGECFSQQTDIQIRCVRQQLHMFR